jgi:sec-independent protein translocase protein TatB
VFNLSGSEMIFLLLIALVVLGPEKLPEAVRRFGKAYGEFKKVTSGFQTELRSALDEPMREMRDTADAMRKAANLDFNFDGSTDQSPAEPAVDQPPAEQVQSDQAATATDAAAATDATNSTDASGAASLDAVSIDAVSGDVAPAAAESLDVGAESVHSAGAVSTVSVEADSSEVLADVDPAPALEPWRVQVHPSESLANASSATEPSPVADVAPTPSGWSAITSPPAVQSRTVPIPVEQTPTAPTPSGWSPVTRDTVSNGTSSNGTSPDSHAAEAPAAEASDPDAPTVDVAGADEVASG